MLGSAGRRALLIACLPALLLMEPLSSGAAQAADVTVTTPTTGTAGNSAGFSFGNGGSGGAGGTGLAQTQVGTVTINATVSGGAGGKGGDGGDGSGGNGAAGGGGLALTQGGTVTINAAVSGGAGGNGGTGGNCFGNGCGVGNGGSGAAGGAGLALTQGGTVTINAAVTGGAGGNGGTGGTGVGGQATGSGGAGDAGGAGLVMTQGGTVMVNAAVTGGSGGTGAGGGSGAGAHGTGGAGITGSGMTLTLGGQANVTGGLAGGGGTRANAITFTGGTNRLEFWSGATVTGTVVAAGTSTFALGGATNGNFDLSQLGPAGQYQGFGTLEKSGTGTWTVSHAPGAMMAWQVSAGTLDLGGTTQTAAAFTLTGGTVRNGTLSSTASFDLQAGTLSAILAGTGGLAKTGAGDVTLTGVNTYSGATTVSAGRLIVNGSIANSSSLTVNAGGTLGGSGTVGTTSIAGGTLAPGNSIGTLSVNGNLSFTAGSTYAVEVSPAASDRVNVTGTATLGGAKVAASFEPGTYVAKQYTILNAAGGIVGTFGQKVDTNLPSGFKSALSYNTNNAFLDLTLDFTPTPPAPTPPVSPIPNQGLNPNQTAAANALTDFFNRTGGIPSVFGSLTPAGLSQASGEPATGVQQTSATMMNQFLGSLTAITPDGRGVPLAPAPTGFASYSSARGQAGDLPTRKGAMAPAITPDPDLWRWSVWAGGYGAAQFNGADAAAGTAATTNRIYGAMAGADYRIAQDTLAGFALGGGATSFNTFGLGSGTSDLFQAGAFIRQQMGRSYLTASAAYAWQDVTTDRSVAGLDRLQGRFNANSWSGRIEAGHRFGLASLGLTPYAAGQFSTLSLPGYRETALSGPGTFALAYAGQDTSRLRGELGLRADAQLMLAGKPLKLEAGAAWIRNGNTGTRALASFQTLPGAIFSVSGTALDRNALRTTASAELSLSKSLTLATTLEGEFAPNSRSLGGKAALRYSW
ncbi:autotransporter domain-containing protein [Bosea sp. (in: a-proteobacteria)]|uniref:autotransporter family protein n=1 Tax=Bosea sp. (in: a-proteobacteria) TaxID=1871050 RepID=UPI002B459FBA|nr:autotransporter domain-containing protein [Bosea sp. (in: a-proteobacteria)]WRH56075.1 MAG: autotransporter domain-containing protein [Bosea sp. (in: a-proteobacteria)]